MNSQKEQSPTLDSMISAAKAEKWEYIDQHIGRFAKHPDSFLWASNVGLEDSDENVRDLAATTLERSDYGFSPEVQEKLSTLVNAPAGKYDRFRAACALLRHGLRPPGTVERIREFRDDPDVDLIARKYLKELEHEWPGE